jgi:hypothetical protein
VGGVCEAVTPCQDDNACTASGKVCHTTRGYCVQCDGRHTNECPAGTTCQFDFTCAALTAGDGGVSDGGSCSGQCTDRTMCGTDQVCRGGACCPPPARCVSINDCPVNRPECNGATGECFGGDSCIQDMECDGKPGCAPGACFCDAPAVGQPGECRARPDECQDDMGCWQNGAYAGKVCTVQASPRRCVDAPNCTGDVACASLGLVCDLVMASPSYQRCVNGTPCPNGNECNPSTQACVDMVCVGKNCNNTPNFCMANERCDMATGTCLPLMSGTCTTDGMCNPGFWCNTAVNMCELGCRDSSECSGGVCDANHRCQQPTGNVCGPCTSDADCPAGTNCRPHSIRSEMLCYEACNAFAGEDCMLNPNAVCFALRCACP